MGAPAKVALTVDTGDRIRAHVTAQGDGYLVVADASMRGLHAEVDELRHRRDNRRRVSSADGAGPIGDADEIHAVQGTEHPDVVAPHRAQADDPRP